ncbi:MAG: 2-C-methyl-D-erythritol 4-phosphate cytidylyltransferase [Hungatella sp.]|nr:2-C-methyl-D-erythritol 4-phosphate cytidylyltransferase [Hungatella sp.]
MEESRRETAAVILAAGRGTRMGGSTRKQYLELEGRPLICHALEAFERSPVDRIVLVTGAGEEEYCKREIVDACGFSKVTAVVPGGRERYHSVYEGLKAVGDCDIVLIHDGARPCVTEEIIRAAMDGAAASGACVIGMPVKDTIKVADDHEDAEYTPDRSRLWLIQTPQAFSCRLITAAYEALLADPYAQQGVTDDAMVVEKMSGQKVHLIRGSYENIKVTTPEDLEVAGVFLRRRKKE